MNPSWLGYRVDSPAGFVGRVESIVSSEDDPSSLLLAVRLGRSGRRVSFFRLNDIGCVDSPRRAVVLSRVEPRPHDRIAAFAERG
jgi:hypothetical protein